MEIDDMSTETIEIYLKNRKEEMMEMTEKKVICYYHSDMDGIASGSIVKKVYPNAKFVKVDYGDEHSFETGYDICIVVDFSFDKQDMELLIKNHKIFCWIDHHKTAMEANKELWDSEDIDGLRSLDKSGCELTWEWFFPHEEMPKAIKLIGDRDMWKFKYGRDTKSFHEFISMTVKEPNVTILDTDNKWIENALDQGCTLLPKKEEQVKMAVEQGCDIELDNNTTRLINTDVNISEVGEYCYKELKYPVALIWSVQGKKVVCSLRSNTVDVSEIAKKYGGGGHKFAAGFEGNLEYIQKLME